MKKILFVRIPKNASVSAICLFEDENVKILQNSLGRERIQFAWTNTLFNTKLNRQVTHLTKNTRKTEEIIAEQDYWDKFYSFCFVRNPYERAVSSWKFGSWKESWDCSFEEYLLKLKDMKEKLEKPFFGDGDRGLLHHSTIQYYYIHKEGELKVDFVGKVETFKKDLRKMLGTNGLTEINWVPHRNKTKHRSYEEYYSTATRDLVEEIYELDIKTFDYSF